MTENRSYPPWTLEQVQSLGAYQAAGAMHPFTCPYRGDGGHGWSHLPEQSKGDLGELVPTLGGWYCPDCDYTQEWAWEWMVDGTWKSFRW